MASLTVYSCSWCGVPEGEPHKPGCKIAEAHRKTLAQGKNGEMNKSPHEVKNTDPTGTIIVFHLPLELEQYEHDFRRFIDAMIYKLGKNVHKGRWEGMPIDKAMKLLEAEVAELHGAIASDNMIEKLLEAADVANFAMIVAAIAVERGK